MNARSIRFVFADPPGFSGQRNAARIIWDGMRARGWHCDLLPLPTADRTSDTGRGLVSSALAVGRIIQAWLAAIRLRRRAPAGITFLACSQTVAGLVRDGVAFTILTAGRRGGAAVISLNGNLFASWSRRGFCARALRWLARNASIITVVGDGQRDRLVALGIPARMVRVIPNTADCPVCTVKATTAKQREVDRPVRILYLSSLITSKGYPMLLEALRMISDRDGPQLEAVLCGAIVASPHDAFGSESTARTWIDSITSEINRSQRVTVRWLPGAVGAAKNDLLARCHIFTLPTQYPVEAQPLSLLEAMASGCAIVATGIAEIPTILPPDTKTAVLLDHPTPASLAAAIERLAADADTRTAMAVTARDRFEKLFAPHRHLDAWESIFAGLGTPS